MSHLIEVILSDREAGELAKFLARDFGIEKGLTQYADTTALIKIQASLLDSLERQRELKAALERLTT